MLKTVELIEKMGKEYESMLKQVNIPDFYKCISQYSGIEIKNLKDIVIEDYLITWAKNKKHIFDFFGGNIRIDSNISYRDEDRNYNEKLLEIAKKFPAYYTWLMSMNRLTSNELSLDKINWDTRDMIRDCFPDYKYNGESLTHFFKNKLNAPDTLVTELGRVYENLIIEANFTMSIDPVDIMLSSENPYNWQSCYRLEQGISDSHADGCLAGVLDSATIITYIWNEEGKFNLYGQYDFKNIRYKRMRMTIATNKQFNAIHFNTIYPGKGSLSEEFNKQLRDKIETYFAKQLNKTNIWVKNDDNYSDRIHCYREHSEYGYNEYDDYSVWKLKEEEKYEDIIPYNEPIHCPCGCFEYYEGSYERDEDYEYNGEGHTNENWNESSLVWCEETDGYEDCNGDCEHCRLWNENHVECELDGGYCDEISIYEAESEGMIDLDNDNVIHCNPEMCENCPRYKEHFANISVEEEN